MKAHLVCLNYKTRYSLPKVGDFLYLHAHQYLAWKGRVITDAGELSRSINEALDALDRMALYGIGGRVRVVEVEIEEASPAQEATASAEVTQSLAVQEPTTLPQESEKRPRGRPRKLLTTS